MRRAFCKIIWHIICIYLLLRPSSVISSYYHINEIHSMRTIQHIECAQLAVFLVNRSPMCQHNALGFPINLTDVLRASSIQPIIYVLCAVRIFVWNISSSPPAKLLISSSFPLPTQIYIYLYIGTCSFSTLKPVTAHIAPRRLNAA